MHRPGGTAPSRTSRTRTSAAARPGSWKLRRRRAAPGVQLTSERRTESSRLGVEQVHLVERDVERDDVARADAPLGGDDRDEVLARHLDVEQLLVAEVLDDVRPGVDGGGLGAGGDDVPVLRPDPDDEVAARGRADPLAEGGGDRDLDALGLERRSLAGSLEGHRDEVHRRAADEAGHELVDRAVVELLGRADLLQLGLAHDGDPLAHRHRLDLVVGDVDDRRLEALVEARDLGAGLDAQLGVEVGERLVHEEDGGLADDGPAQGDALALAAGELLGLARQEGRQLDRLGRLLDPPVDLLLVDLAELEAEGQVVVDGHVRVERVALEDHRDVAVLGATSLTTFSPIDSVPR